jgi:hypothetical protein
MFLFLLLLVALANAQQKKSVGVLPSIGSIDETSLEMLTKDLRTIAVNALPADAFSVLAQETVMMRLGGSAGYLTACRESEGCIAELGKKAKVDYVARCNVNSVDGVLMMDVELYNSNTGGIVGSFNSYGDDAKKIGDLIALMRKSAPEMFKKIPSIAGAAEAGGFGILEIKPAYEDGIGRGKKWSLAIDGKAHSSFDNRLSAGSHDVRLRHECYEDVNHKASVAKGKREVFDMAGSVRLKSGDLELRAERGGLSVAEPVFANGRKIGETPFIGSVPVCSEIEIGREREEVDVRLKHNDLVRWKHRMDDGYDPPQSESVESGIYKVKKEKAFYESSAFWAVASNLVGLGLVAIGYWQNGEYDRLRGEYRGLPDSSGQGEFDKAWEKAEGAKSARNGLYIAGGIVFGAGVVLWIF